MKTEHHPHTLYWFQTNLGLSSVPRWYSTRQRLIGELADLWNARQALYYEALPESSYRALQRSLSHRYGISYGVINHFLGVAATDSADPFGVIRDYLSDAEPKLRRTRSK
jgi:hypothetical protein